jgi:hypothetical protein
MIDRPPAPFFITTAEDGMPLLILHDTAGGPTQQQQQQARTIATAEDADSRLQVTSSRVTPGSSADDLTASNGSTPDAYAVADAEARVGQTVARSAGSKTALASALKGSSQSFTQQQQQQQQQQQALDSKPKHVAFAPVGSTAAAAEPSDDIAADADAAAAADVTRSPDQQQQQQQGGFDPQTQSLPLPVLPRASPPQAHTWMRLTAGSLRRLSVDSCSMRSASNSTTPGWRDPSSSTASGVGDNRVAIPLMLQGPAAGSSGSFLSAAVPAEALGPAAPAAEGDDGFGGAGVLVAGPPPAGASGEGPAGDAAGAVSGVGDGSISSMLAAANSCRDYEVSCRLCAWLHHLSQCGASLLYLSCSLIVCSPSEAQPFCPIADMHETEY